MLGVRSDGPVFEPKPPGPCITRRIRDSHARITPQERARLVALENGTTGLAWIDRLVSGASNDWQVRVAREPRIGRRPLAKAEQGAAPGLDDPRMAARAAQPGWWWRAHRAIGAWAVRTRRKSDDPSERTRVCISEERRAATAVPPSRRSRVAERVGFEPTKSFDSALFKSAAINRSATSPAARVAVATRRAARWSGRLLDSGCLHDSGCLS